MRRSVNISSAKSSEKDANSRSGTPDSSPPPAHFGVHRPGFQIESCCGVCNLFPGVLLTAFSQVLAGAILLTLLLSNEELYDSLHETTGKTVGMSFATGLLLSTILGAGLLLIVVALTENCRAMLVYLMVAVIIVVKIFVLAIVKIGRGCSRFQYVPNVRDEEHRLANMACSCGLFTFLGGVAYVYSFMVVFSFYHFRYVRRAILLHEAECVPRTRTRTLLPSPARDEDATVTVK